VLLKYATKKDRHTREKDQKLSITYTITKLCQTFIAKEPCVLSKKNLYSYRYLSFIRNIYSYIHIFLHVHLVCKESIIYMYVSFVRNMYSYICVSFCKEYILYVRLFCKEYMFLTKQTYIYIIYASLFVRNIYDMHVSFVRNTCFLHKRCTYILYVRLVL